MPLMYSSLNDRQKCMYHAWGRTEGIPKDQWGTKLGALVTDQGHDADDSIAAVIFAKKFGFEGPRGCTGRKLQEFISVITETCTYVVLALEQYKKDGKEFKPAADYFTGSAFRDVSVILTDPVWEYLEWHAIVCEVVVTAAPGPGGTAYNRKVTWYDDQESRYNRNGPPAEKCCLFFARWKKDE